MKKRLRFIQGGTSASKTVGVIMFLIAMAQSDKSATLTSIVSESLPHLKKGAMRDFLLILKEHGYYREENWSRTDFTYTFETGSQIEFFGVDQPDKTRGPRRDRLFMNEANNIKFEAFEQLEVRTKECIIADWNPTNEFWAYTEVINKRDDVETLKLTYKDNEALSKEIIGSIEQRKGNASWWKVYGLGELGEVEGKVYKDWQIIDEIPHEARLEVRGLDFGFTNDPTVLQDIYRYNGGFIIDERLRQKGMHNDKIAAFIQNLNEPQTLIIADSAEPKSIEEIATYGVNIIGAIKGQGSVKRGIDFVQSQQVSITKRSVNTIKSYRNYLYKVDRDGKILNDPHHDFSDEMDAIRYGMSNFQPNEQEDTEDWGINETDW